MAEKDMSYLYDQPVAVLGGGNAAHALAADLTDKGFKVNMYEMPRFKHQMQKVFDTKKIEAIGVINGIYELNMVTDVIEDAIKDVKYIFIITPAFAHKGYGGLLKDVVTKEQVIITIPGSFAALQYKQVFGDRECPTFVDANNLMYDTRLVTDGKVNILERDTIDVGFLPTDREPLYLEELREMVDIKAVFPDVLSCGLALVNPALHSGPCLLNAGSIESPFIHFFLYQDGITPSAMKLDKRLDDERKAICAALGYEGINPFRCFPLIDRLEKEGKDYEWEDLYRDVHGDIGLTPIAGPNDIKSRYLTEDAPCGLVPWSIIAKTVGVKTTAIDAIIDIYSIIHETDWWNNGFTLADLGLEGMNKDEIRAYCKTGIK